MALRYEIEQHATCFPVRMLASKHGKHILNIIMNSDTDNGCLVGKGSPSELDSYEEDTASTFKGYVLPFKSPDGNYYVEVEDPGDSYLVCSVANIKEEYSTAWQNPSNFFNAEGDVARCYEIAPNDRFEVSNLAFSSAPKDDADILGKQINSILNKKMVLS